MIFVLTSRGILPTLFFFVLVTLHVLTDEPQSSFDIALFLLNSCQLCNCLAFFD